MKRPSVKELEKRVAALESERAELLRRLAAIEARSWPQYQHPPRIGDVPPTRWGDPWPFQQPWNPLNNPMCYTQGGKI